MTMYARIQIDKPTQVIERGEIITLDPSKEPYWCCTVCGIWKSESIFAPNGVTRTNCEACYNLSHDLYVKTDAETQMIANSPETQKLKAHLKNQAEIEFAAIPVEDMIKALKKLPKGSQLVISQQGYYAEGRFADIFLPKKFSEGVYEIGLSCQNY